MRQPYLNALSLQSSFELEDEVDDELDRIKVPKTPDVVPEKKPIEELKAASQQPESAVENPAPPATTEKKEASSWGRFFFGGTRKP